VEERLTQEQLAQVIAEVEKLNNRREALTQQRRRDRFLAIGVVATLLSAIALTTFFIQA
jgi:hypothetical protein